MSARLASVFSLFAAAVVCLVGCPARAAESHDFSRYQVILDRSPFGPVSGPADAVQPNFAARFAFVGLATTGENQPLIAFIHDRERNRIYPRAEGESIEGITVVRVEKSPAKLVLKLGLEVATLALEPRPSVGVAPMAQPQPAQPGAPGPVRRIPFRRGG